MGRGDGTQAKQESGRDNDDGAGGVQSALFVL